MKYHIINVLVIIFAISSPVLTHAQCGFLVTTTDGEKELVSGDRFNISVNSAGDDGTATIGSQSLKLSEITNIQSYPRPILNGDPDDWNQITCSGLEFVGDWDGSNYTVNTKQNPNAGIWTFLNDGTFTWTTTAISGQNLEGEWRYDDVTKMIYTNSYRCPVLSVISVAEDMVVLKNETYSQFYTLTRREHNVTLNAPHVIEFRPDGFVVRASFNNHLYINQPQYKLGIKYALAGALDVQYKVYANNVVPFELPTMGNTWEDNGMPSYYNSPEFGVLGGIISINGLTVGDLVRLIAFAEFPDGSVIETTYSSEDRYRVITPPENGIFLGNRPTKNGYITFWYNTPIDENGEPVDANQYSVYVSEEAADEAINKLKSLENDTRWALPYYDDLLDRDGYSLAAFLRCNSRSANLYSPLNYATVPSSLPFGNILLTQNWVGKYHYAELKYDSDSDNPCVINRSESQTAKTNRKGYVWPCIRLYVHY